MNDDESNPADERTALAWRVVEAQHNALWAKAEESPNPDYFAIEQYMVLREQQLRVFALGLDTLPGDRGIIAEVLLAEVIQHGFVDVDARKEPARFRAAFAVASRFSNARIHGRGEKATLIRVDVPSPVLVPMSNRPSEN